MTERATVAVVGAGPTGVTAATLLAQQGVDVLVLDRYPDVFPRPRAVHLDDEVYRILARMGVGAEFAAISRPAKGLRLLDADSRVLAEFARSTAAGIHGFPQASMFDQPELERLLRANLARRPSARLRGNVEVTGIVRHAMAGHGRVTVELTDLATGRSDAVLADYVLGCDGANSAVRDAIGVRMAGLGFEQRWLVVDIATDTDLGQWDGVHQVCSPRRAATYMRIGADRYRFEFQLLDGEIHGGLQLGPGAATAAAAVDRCRSDPRGSPARPGGRVHVPGPGRAAVARGADLPARRRGTSQPALHRPGPGRGSARRGQPGLEVDRRPARRPPGVRSGQLSGRTAAARPDHDPKGDGDRVGDDRRRTGRRSAAQHAAAPDTPVAGNRADHPRARPRRCAVRHWSGPLR